MVPPLEVPPVRAGVGREQRIDVFQRTASSNKAIKIDATPGGISECPTPKTIIFI
jgi:hypothetical protein